MQCSQLTWSGYESYTQGSRTRPSERNAIRAEEKSSRSPVQKEEPVVAPTINDPRARENPPLRATRCRRGHSSKKAPETHRFALMKRAMHTSALTNAGRGCTTSLSEAISPITRETTGHLKTLEEFQIQTCRAQHHSTTSRLAYTTPVIRTTHLRSSRSPCTSNAAMRN